MLTEHEHGQPVLQMAINTVKRFDIESLHGVKLSKRLALYYMVLVPVNALAEKMVYVRST